MSDHRIKKPKPQSSLPPLPIDAGLWEAVAKAMRLSPQLARAVELVLRDMSDEQIARAMDISESTLRTYFDRIALRTGARRRSGIFRTVLSISHQINHEPS
jgi:DNA-binding CsgD family transcriptional regulator